MEPIQTKLSNMINSLHNRWDQYTHSKQMKISITIITTIVSSIWISRSLYHRLSTDSKNNPKLPAGPMGLPFLGSYLQMKRDSLKFFASLPLFYGPLCCVKIGNTNIITISSPQIARNIYINHNKSVINRYITGINHSIYNGFSLQNGEKWSKRRKIIQSQLLTITNSTFIDYIARSILNNHIFKEFNNKNIVYTRNLFRNLTFCIIYCAIFGKDECKTYEFNGDIYKKYDKFINDIFKSQQPSTEITLLFGENSWISNFIWNHSKHKRLFMNTVKNMGDTILAKYIETKTKFEINPDDIKIQKNTETLCFCEYIYKHQKSGKSKIKYSDEDIAADIGVMMEAGIDTAAATMEYAVILSTLYPDIQDEIYDELKNVFGDYESFKLKASTLKFIPKLRAFIYETLRLFPPSSQSFLRKITKDININVDENRYLLPKNNLIIMNIEAMNYNKKYWNIDNAKELNLKIWLDSNGNFKKHPSFTTFGLSKRDCPGSSLAIRELLIILGMLFLKYKFVANNMGYKQVKDVKIKSMLINIIDPEVGVFVEKRV